MTENKQKNDPATRVQNVQENRITILEEQTKNLYQAVGELTTIIEELVRTRVFETPAQNNLKNCESCNIQISPVKPSHRKCKTCFLTPQIIPCKNCNKNFQQIHKSHKYCQFCKYPWVLDKNMSPNEAIPPRPQTEQNALLQRVEQLERRVHQLEQEKIRTRRKTRRAMRHITELLRRLGHLIENWSAEQLEELAWATH